MDDLSLNKLVLATLERLPLVPPANIAVSVHQGIVVLTGRCADASHKAIIELAVLNLPGVRGLARPYGGFAQIRCGVAV